MSENMQGHVWADELIETDEGILCHRFRGIICEWDPHMCDLDCPHFRSSEQMVKKDEL